MIASSEQGESLMGVMIPFDRSSLQGRELEYILARGWERSGACLGGGPR